MIHTANRELWTFALFCCFYALFFKFFFSLSLWSWWCERSGQIKNEEHTPQIHIWNNLIQLFILLFCHFFPHSSLLFFIYPAVLFPLCLLLFCFVATRNYGWCVRTCLRLISINSRIDKLANWLSGSPHFRSAIKCNNLEIKYELRLFFCCLFKKPSIQHLTKKNTRAYTQTLHAGQLLCVARSFQTI